MCSKPAGAPAARNLQDLLRREGADFVRAAYRTLLLRDPDPGGLVAYLSRLQQGTPKLQLLEELRASPEGRQRGVWLDGWPVTLGADADADADVSSLERLLTLRGDAFLHQAYQLLLDREADAQGLAFYRGQLDRGVAPGQVLAEIASSDEYLRRGRPLPGLQQIIRRHRRRQLPLAQTLLRLFRQGRVRVQPQFSDPVVAPLPAPATATSMVDAERADADTPRARPLNPARAALMSLPDPLSSSSTRR